MENELRGWGGREAWGSSEGVLGGWAGLGGKTALKHVPRDPGFCEGAPPSHLIRRPLATVAPPLTLGSDGGLTGRRRGGARWWAPLPPLGHLSTSCMEQEDVARAWHGGMTRLIDSAGLSVVTQVRQTVGSEAAALGQG